MCLLHKCLFQNTAMGKISWCLTILALGSYSRITHAEAVSEPECQCKPATIPDYEYCYCYRSTAFLNATNYNFTELPSGVTDLILGNNIYPGLDGKTCSTDPLLRLSDVPRLSNTTTRLQVVRFCNFDFDNGRVAQVGSWLGEKKNQLRGLEVQCGTMRTLGRGTFRGYTNMRTLMIYMTGLEHIELGAFSEMGFDSSTRYRGFAIIMSFDNLTTFDWAVLKHVAPHLQTIKLEGNGMRTMRVTREVSFPALKYVDLSGNALETIPQPVLGAWSQSTDMEIYLKGIPLCSQDALCRCCSLAALHKFATDSNSRVEVTCGDISNGRAMNGTDLVSMLSDSATSSLCVKDYFQTGNLTDMGNVTSYDQCTGNDDKMSCQLK